MVDNLSILITHVLIALAIWRLVPRTDLDVDPDDAQNQPHGWQ